MNVSNLLEKNLIRKRNPKIGKILIKDYCKQRGFDGRRYLNTMKSVRDSLFNMQRAIDYRFRAIEMAVFRQPLVHPEGQSQRGLDLQMREPEPLANYQNQTRKREAKFAKDKRHKTKKSRKERTPTPSSSSGSSSEEEKRARSPEQGSPPRTPTPPPSPAVTASPRTSPPKRRKKE